jgi:hypothetical protein
MNLEVRSSFKVNEALESVYDPHLWEKKAAEVSRNFFCYARPHIIASGQGLATGGLL